MNSPIAKKASFTIEGIAESMLGYTLGETWNGAACPYFEKRIGKRIADAYTKSNEIDKAIMEYDQPSDSFIEVCEGEKTPYKGVRIETENGTKKLYPIGAFAWTWTTDRDVSICTDDTLEAAYRAFNEAAVNLQQELGACMEYGRDDHARDSDVFPSAEEMLDEITGWATDSANAVCDSLFEEGAHGMPIQERFVARMKQEIFADLDRGILSPTIRSFSELHDFVDANEYGGFCNPRISDRLYAALFHREGPGDELLVDFSNACQTAIHDWLEKGGILETH
jgi:hypothetical protein